MKIKATKILKDIKNFSPEEIKSYGRTKPRIINTSYIYIFIIEKDIYLFGKNVNKSITLPNNSKISYLRDNISVEEIEIEEIEYEKFLSYVKKEIFESLLNKLT